MKKLPICCGFLLLCLAFFTCSQPGSDASAKTEVKPRFENNPPPVGDISVMQLADTAGGNFLFVADFGKALDGARFHAVMVDDQKVVLRDDGKLGDEKAGDGKFSVKLRKNVDQLRDQLIGSAGSFAKQPDFMRFSGGTFTRIPVEQLQLRALARFKFELVQSL